MLPSCKSWEEVQTLGTLKVAKFGFGSLKPPTSHPRSWQPVPPEKRRHFPKASNLKSPLKNICSAVIDSQQGKLYRGILTQMEETDMNLQTQNLNAPGTGVSSKTPIITMEMGMSRMSFRGDLQDGAECSFKTTKQGYPQKHKHTHTHTK